jgi:hypothetical protein
MIFYQHKNLINCCKNLKEIEYWESLQLLVVRKKDFAHMTSVEDIIAVNMAAVDTHFHAEDTNSVELALSAFTDE